MKQHQSLFPQDFLWGASTSSHQVEGGNCNDWTVWEPKHAQRVVRQNRHRLAVDNYISGDACDHYHRYEEDFDIAKSLHMNAYRFSIEWSRIEPEEGVFDKDEIEHYREMIQALRQRGIEPIVTLWHWTFPIWFAEKGGWLSSDAVKLFNRYVERVVVELGQDIRYWITLNEPGVYSTNSYLIGRRPPQYRNPLQYLAVIQRMIAAHKTAYQSIHRINPEAQVGIAHDCYYFELARPTLLNRLAQNFIGWWRNYNFLNHIAQYQDFIGVNYYVNHQIDINVFQPMRSLRDQGYREAPRGLYALLVDLWQRYDKPLIITENGMIASDDTGRSWYIQEIVRQLGRALRDGVDLRGYLHWSLLDNFEWESGFHQRFGLVEIDYKTMKRHIRPSAKVYGEIIKRNGVIDD